MAADLLSRQRQGQFLGEAPANYLSRLASGRVSTRISTYVVVKGMGVPWQVAWARLPFRIEFLLLTLSAYAKIIVRRVSFELYAGQSQAGRPVHRVMVFAIQAHRDDRPIR